MVSDAPVELSRLPVLDKTQMMEHYDELVTDRRLTACCDEDGLHGNMGR